MNRQKNILNTSGGYNLNSRFKAVFFVIAGIIVIQLVAACTMFQAWRTIPAPGGCEECHKVPISANWQVAYRPAVLSDERNRVYFQTEEYAQQQKSKPQSQLDRQKVEELTCFECHNAPNSAHKTMKGKFHH